MYISTYESFIDKSIGYFKKDNYNKKYLETIIDFLITDLNNSDLKNIDISLSPFVKIGENIFWLSTLYRDLNWGNFIYRKIVNERLLKHIEQSLNIETYVANQFLNNGFIAISNFEFKINNKEGEIDVVVCSDNKILMFELKLTYVTQDIDRNSYYNFSNFEMKATEQLDKIKEYMENNPQELFHKLGIENKEYEIEYFILSNIFYFDDIFISSKYLKISLFELMIILNNDLFSMLNVTTQLRTKDIMIPDYVSQKYHNRNNPFINETDFDVSKEACDLSNGKGRCDIHDILNAIKENKVWQHLDKVYNEKFGPIPLVEWSDTYKFLRL